jgi:DeoR/GlpR family transcriptional regulator of sugar metabolism
MLSAERQQTIGRLVAQHGAVNVADLARQFQVSRSTIRRDLEQLEKQGVVHRTHGGAVKAGGSATATVITGFGMVRIGRAAAVRIRANETVFLGPGDLTLEVAKALVDRRNVTVITNSLEIAHWLATNPGPMVILTGGTVGRVGAGLAGPLVTYALRTLRADRVLIEAAGICPDQGLTSADLEQAELNRYLISSPGEAIALVPPERVGRVGGILVGPAGDLDVIVTGRDAPQMSLWDLSQLGIDIITV